MSALLNKQNSQINNNDKESIQTEIIKKSYDKTTEDYQINLQQNHTHNQSNLGENYEQKEQNIITGADAAQNLATHEPISQQNPINYSGNSSNNKQQSQSPSEAPQLQSQISASQSKPDYKVLVLGKSGAGKTTAINMFFNLAFSKLYEEERQIAITQKFNLNGPEGQIYPSILQNNLSEFKQLQSDTLESSSKSQTTQCFSYKIVQNSYDISFIDTPGLCDTDGADTDNSNLELIKSAVSAISNIDLVLYVHRATDLKKNDFLANYVNILRKQVLPDRLKNNFIVCFTGVFNPLKIDSARMLEEIGISTKQKISFENDCLLPYDINKIEDSSMQEQYFEMSKKFWKNNKKQYDKFISMVRQMQSTQQFESQIVEVSLKNEQNPQVNQKNSNICINETNDSQKKIECKDNFYELNLNEQKQQFKLSQVLKQQEEDKLKNENEKKFQEMQLQHTQQQQQQEQQYQQKTHQNQSQKEHYQLQFKNEQNKLQQIFEEQQVQIEEQNQQKACKAYVLMRLIWNSIYQLGKFHQISSFYFKTIMSIKFAILKLNTPIKKNDLLYKLSDPQPFPENIKEADYKQLEYPVFFCYACLEICQKPCHIKEEYDPHGDENSRQSKQCLHLPLFLSKTKYILQDQWKIFYRDHYNVEQINQINRSDMTDNSQLLNLELSKANMLVQYYEKEREKIDQKIIFQAHSIEYYLKNAEKIKIDGFNKETMIVYINKRNQLWSNNIFGGEIISQLINSEISSNMTISRDLEQELDKKLKEENMKEYY